MLSRQRPTLTTTKNVNFSLLNNSIYVITSFLFFTSFVDIKANTANGCRSIGFCSIAFLCISNFNSSVHPIRPTISVSFSLFPNSIHLIAINHFDLSLMKKYDHNNDKSLLAFRARKYTCDQCKKRHTHTHKCRFLIQGDINLFLF